MAFPISIHICRVPTASVVDSSNTAVKNGATLNEFVARINANKQIQMSSALNIEGVSCSSSKVLLSLETTTRWYRRRQ
ncbi:hypothetical protein [Prevotella sp.]|uniref:hypothetical protein n=1 Tax=Prevotella sp. TaxID=59823 RepID=UPI003F816C8A